MLLSRFGQKLPFWSDNARTSLPSNILSSGIILMFNHPYLRLNQNLGTDHPENCFWCWLRWTGFRSSKPLADAPYFAAAASTWCSYIISVEPSFNHSDSLPTGNPEPNACGALRCFTLLPKSVCCLRIALATLTNVRLTDAIRAAAMTRKVLMVERVRWNYLLCFLQRTAIMRSHKNYPFDYSLAAHHYRLRPPKLSTGMKARSFLLPFMLYAYWKNGSSL